MRWICLLSVLLLGWMGASPARAQGFLGEVKLFGGKFHLRYHAFGTGLLMLSRENEQMNATLGDRFGGDGRETYRMPDLRKLESSLRKGVTVRGYENFLKYVICEYSRNGRRHKVGDVRLFAGKTIPSDWAHCDGRKLRVLDNNFLYSIIGHAYGGDGRLQFALPDLRKAEAEIHKLLPKRSNAGKDISQGKLRYVIAVKPRAGPQIKSLEPLRGEIKIIAGKNPDPKQWLPCTGQLKVIANNFELYSILGPSYGGDGRQWFGLPKMQRPQARLNDHARAGKNRPTLQYVIAVRGQWPERP